MLAGIFLCGCQVQEVNQVSDKYLQGYILELDNWKMTTLSWKEHSAPSVIYRLIFLFVAAIHSGSSVGWSIKYQILHRKEQAPVLQECRNGGALSMLQAGQSGDEP
jgi:hypothetical protein